MMATVVLQFSLFYLSFFVVHVPSPAKSDIVVPFCFAFSFLFEMIHVFQLIFGGRGKYLIHPVSRILWSKGPIEKP